MHLNVWTQLLQLYKCTQMHPNMWTHALTATFAVTSTDGFFLCTFEAHLPHAFEAHHEDVPSVQDTSTLLVFLRLSWSDFCHLPFADCTCAVQRGSILRPEKEYGKKFADSALHVPAGIQGVSISHTSHCGLLQSSQHTLRQPARLDGLGCPALPSELLWHRFFSVCITLRWMYTFLDQTYLHGCQQFA